MRTLTRNLGTAIAMLGIISPAMAGGEEPQDMQITSKALTGISLCMVESDEFCMGIRPQHSFAGGVCSPRNLIRTALKSEAFSLATLSSGNMVLDFFTLHERLDKEKSMVTLRFFTCEDTSGNPLFENGEPTPAVVCLTPHSGAWMDEEICVPATIQA